MIASQPTLRFAFIDIEIRASLGKPILTSVFLSCHIFCSYFSVSQNSMAFLLCHSPQNLFHIDVTFLVSHGGCSFIIFTFTFD